MAFNAVNPVVVGGSTKKDHYDRVLDNTVALRAGAIAIPSQAAGDFITALSSEQLSRIGSADLKLWIEVFSG